LILSGSTNVNGCKAAAQGGGVLLGDYTNPYLMSMFDSAAVTGNASAGYPHGGGIYVQGSSRLEMRGRSGLRNNTTVGYGGGIATGYGGSLAMYDDAEITENTADTYSGGVYLYGGADRPHSLELYGNARIWNNHAQSGAGGVYYYYDNDIVVMKDHASIHDNTTASGYGGGIFFETALITLLMSGSASITGNAAGTPAPTGGGLYRGKVFLYENAQISGNTPDQCFESIGC
ncbi:MAG: hypothetical protein ACR2J8_05745, partial [Thermomicrobiales bacterium]